MLLQDPLKNIFGMLGGSEEEVKNVKSLRHED